MNREVCQHYKDPDTCEECAEDRRRDRLSDSYWLRVYAGQAMQGMLSRGAGTSDLGKIAVNYAISLLAEIKRVEANND